MFKARMAALTAALIVPAALAVAAPATAQQNVTIGVSLAQDEEVVPEPHHLGIEAAGRALEEMVLALGVLEHEAQARDAVPGKPSKVALDALDIAAAAQAIEFRPGDGVVLTDRRPRLAGLGDEVRRAVRDRDPRQGGLARAVVDPVADTQERSVASMHGLSRDPE